MCLVVLQVLNGDEREQTSAEERQSESVPDVIVEARYSEEEEEEDDLSKKMEATTLHDKGVCVLKMCNCAVCHRVNVC